MALFIGSGTPGRSAIDIGRDLLKKFGSIGALGTLPVAELAKEKGIGPAKASKLAAAFELGSRVAREHLKDTPLDTPDLIYEYFAPQLRHLTQEHVIVATVDTRLRLSSTTLISVGSVNEATAHPRDIMRPIITRGAYGFILVHNHPSGDASPSRSDEFVTRNLVEAAKLMMVRFLDHVIIGRPSPGRSAYFSFREAGLVP
jgi:DNA repair protein RadC